MNDAILQAVARGWCSPKNSHKAMDPDLAKAIAREVRAALSLPAGVREVLAEMRGLADKIAQAGINGFGNQVNDCVDRIEAALSAAPVAPPDSADIRGTMVARRMAWPKWFHAFVTANQIVTHGMGKFGEGPVWCDVLTDGGVVRAYAGDWITCADGNRLGVIAAAPQQTLTASAEQIQPAQELTPPRSTGAS